VPWELTVKSELADRSLKSNDWPLLGRGSELCRRISECLPTVQWHREPSFLEQHQHLPEDHPIRSFMDSSTAEQKEWNARRGFKGLYEGEGFTLEFFFKDGLIRFFHIDVRGGGNPLQSLARLCSANKWAVQDVTGKVVDLDLPSAPGWGEFTQWRDRAVNEISEKLNTEDAGD
jgi:hypothetical protein